MTDLTCEQIALRIRTSVPLTVWGMHAGTDDEPTIIMQVAIVVEQLIAEALLRERNKS